MLTDGSDPFVFGLLSALLALFCFPLQYLHRIDVLASFSRESRACQRHNFPNPVISGTMRSVVCAPGLPSASLLIFCHYNLGMRSSGIVPIVFASFRLLFPTSIYLPFAFVRRFGAQVSDSLCKYDVLSLMKTVYVACLVRLADADTMSISFLA
jgi:hypothetical protein